jgi:hypothetical protein
MRFYFPDSQDLISPTYDFVHDEYHPLRVRQRDDRYAHEVLTPAPYDGILVSKAVVDGTAKGAGKYSEPQRQRLYRYGVHEFFRLPDGMRSMGDCGAFNYVTEPEPPYSVQDVADFYEHCGFDEGVSVDHVILGYAPQADSNDVNPDWKTRQELTLKLAADFLDEVESRGTPFEPLGAAQGWSPESYAASVLRLQQIGYTRIAMGGMVPLKTRDILDVLRAVRSILKPEVQLHLLGVTRVEAMPEFAELGATSFDSTMAMRQAFMDDRNNYHTASGAYAAVRIPQVDGNPSLKRAILAGEVPQQAALRLERAALKTVREYGAHRASLEETLEVVTSYEQLTTGGKKNYSSLYRDTLGDRPWEACDCTICRALGVEVVVFRGTERNKRRGFHNLHVLNRKVRLLGLAQSRL